MVSVIPNEGHIQGQMPFDFIKNIMNRGDKHSSTGLVTMQGT
jgi:hypothetical protein